ncbi:hypothetical protein K438DRAFT_2050661 [Mycena galopus ATCC 62051]|nr:hypothetical protein K438DRAFT_2050661 [Mycena galopus ATCC 62051]
MNFQLADLTKSLGFEVETFDIVHARLVMTHVSSLFRAAWLKLNEKTKVVDGREVLHRASRLVKPGGLLLIEDVDLVSLAESGGSATRQIIHKIKGIVDGFGGDAELGKKVEAIIVSWGDFSQVQVKKVTMPFGANGPGEALNQLGLGIKKSFSTMFEPFPNRFHDQGITQELIREYNLNEEQEQSDNKSAMDMYFCWARRSLKGV